MKKIILFTFCTILLLKADILFAQLPEVSTAESPKWYYIQVQGSDSDRKGLLFTNESNKIFGRAKIASLSFTDLNKQLWRFEKTDDGNYTIINKSANRKLDIQYDSGIDCVRAFLKSGTASTNWKITPKGSYFNIEAVTPLSDKATFKFAHQANGYGSRDFSIIMEVAQWAPSADSYFKFIKFEDPNLIMSDENTQTWYVIKSNKSGHTSKCVTDIVSSALPEIKFGIEDQDPGNYSQQWKLVKKTTSTTDKRFEMVNRATGNIIQTSYSVKDGYCYTQSTQNMSESNGWLVNYIGEKEYVIYGTNSDDLKRYLNATQDGETPETYSEGALSKSGFSWLLEPVETTTGLEEVAKPEDWNGITVYSENNHIYVIGADDYTVRTLTGVTVNGNSYLPTGAYLVTVNGKTRVVINK